ncbi:MAG: TlpA family protein disulfide reductase [Acidimicrobiales bacterium]|nr:TlpA family protein disulfide reductase [Acidimicrobiales bacterium]
MTTATLPASGTAPSPKRALFLTLGLLVAAAVIAVIVVLATGGESETTPNASEATRIPQGDVRQVSFAEVVGDPLPAFDPAAPVDAAIGATAPEFIASYFDNGETTVTPGDGQPKVVLFLAHWCPHCQAEVELLADWFAVDGVPTGVDVVAVSTSVDQGGGNYPPSAWFLREGWPLPVLRDSAQRDLAVGYGLNAFPFIVAVDGDGTVVSRSSGGLSQDQWETLFASLGA